MRRTRPIITYRAGAIRVRSLGVVLVGFMQWAAASSQPLADSSAWEPLGEPIQIAGFGFSGNPDSPLIWADGQALWTLQDVTATWSRVNRRVSDGPVLLFGPDPMAPDTIFAGSSLWRSVDGGQTFQGVVTPADLGGSPRVDGPGIDRLPSEAPHAYRFIAGDNLGLLYSDDGGDSWAAADTTPPLLSFSIKALRSGRVIAAGFYGAVRSDDGGVTWNHIPQLYDTTGIRFDLHNITVLPGLVTSQPGDSEEGRVVLTGTSTLPDGGALMWWSDDEGETWSHAPQPGPGCNNGVDVLPLAAETGRPEDVVAVTCQGQVLLSEDGAMTWTLIGQVPGIAGDTWVATAALGPDGRVYAGTHNGSPNDSYSYRTKWRAADGFAARVSGEGDPEGRGGESLSVRPNPSARVVTVYLEGDLHLTGAPHRQRVLVVVDSQGREVARTEMTRSSSWRIDVLSWAPGVYHARVEGEEVEPVAFTVVR